jgi:LAO/AO transport system ATPase
MEVASSPSHPRILLAKIGLDGHDRGVKVLARSFRDAGMEVIYTGLWQTCEATMYAAMQEDVDVVGVSLLSAAHLTVMPEILRLRKELGVTGIPVVLGGIVPDADHPKLLEMGVAAVFNPGSPLDKIIDTLRTLAAGRKHASTTEITAGYAKKEMRSLARLISVVQQGGALNGWSPPKGTARIIGITGAPGVGKSSFIARLGKLLRSKGKRVAVVAIDPSSPITGGALLGDRLRMMTGAPDAEFFVRSIASGDAQGGLAPHCREVVAAINGFGFDFILVETVGAGQSDVAIRELCERVILLLMPDTGDAVQYSKAGIMEIASCFVLNKCDLSGADATEAQLISSVGDTRPIFKASTIRDEGISAVADWAMNA